MQMLLLSIHLPDPAYAPGPHVDSEDKLCSGACPVQTTPVPARGGYHTTFSHTNSWALQRDT